VDNGLISEELRARSTNLPGSAENLAAIQADFQNAYTGNEAAFKQALLQARDYLGRLLAVSWGKLSPDFLTYHDILRTLMRADREITEGAYQPLIRDCFAWREITPVPDSQLLRPHTLRECGLSG
jgi:hypothetical protein